MAEVMHGLTDGRAMENYQVKQDLKPCLPQNRRLRLPVILDESHADVSPMFSPVSHSK